MLQIFGGMIIGSIVTLTLLGGASAANQMLANTQTLYLEQRFNTTTMLLLLVAVSIFLIFLTGLSAPTMDKEKVKKQLHRHCS